LELKEKIIWLTLDNMKKKKLARQSQMISLSKSEQGRTSIPYNFEKNIFAEVKQID